MVMREIYRDILVLMICAQNHVKEIQSSTILPVEFSPYEYHLTNKHIVQIEFSEIQIQECFLHYD